LNYEHGGKRSSNAVITTFLVVCICRPRGVEWSLCYEPICIGLPASCQNICTFIDMEHYGVVGYDTASMVVQFLALKETLCLHLKESGPLWWRHIPEEWSSQPHYLESLEASQHW